MKRIVRVARLGLRLAKEVAPQLPGRGDSVFQRGLKLFASVEAAREVLEGGKGDPVADYVARHNLVTCTSEPFVSLFFDTSLGNEFEHRQFELGKYDEGLEVTGPLGRLLFTLSTLEHKPRATFYHSPKFVPKLAVARTWGAYGGRLAVAVTTLEYGETKTLYDTFPEPSGPMFGAAPARLEALIARHRRFANDGIPRAYGFFGAPGTGKTSLAERFASRLGARTLKLDASSFARLSARSLGYVLGALAPEFLIVDDVDKAEPASLATTLAMLERYKREHKCTLVLTANSTSKFDPGLLRPGRVDEWHRFEPPNEDERRELIVSFLVGAREHPCAETVERLVAASTGLTQDSLREIAQLIERASIEDVEGVIATMKELGAMGAPSPSDSAPPSTKAGTP